MAFFEKSSVDFEGFYDLTDLPIEFLRDPTCWIEAPKVEQFLALIEQHYGPQFPNEQIIEKIGHVSQELRAWGVLDSVLRMMQKPQDIYLQPHRFISYFISPAPPIANIDRGDESVTFEIPISNEEYPRVTEYLRGAFEALPTFMGRHMALAHWRGNRVFVSWAENQEHFFTEANDERNLKPELVHTVLSTLEQTEQELKDKKRELVEKEKLLEQLKAELRLQRSASTLSAPPLTSLQDQVLRLGDYLTRAQQLIILLVAQDRMSPQVKEAMRRMDWERVRLEFPQVVQGTLDLIQVLKDNPERTAQEKIYASHQPDLWT